MDVKGRKDIRQPFVEACMHACLYRRKTRPPSSLTVLVFKASSAWAKDRECSSSPNHLSFTFYTGTKVFNLISMSLSDRVSDRFLFFASKWDYWLIYFLPPDKKCHVVNQVTQWCRIIIGLRIKVHCLAVAFPFSSGEWCLQLIIHVTL